MDELRTARLILRRWRASDRVPFATLNANPDVMRYFPGVLSSDESDALASRIDARFDELGYGLWALDVLATGEFIGFTGLAPMPADVPGEGGVEVGWRLAAHAWHHGFASEAARASIAYGFGQLGLSEINSITAVINVPSRAVMERIGMARVDEFEHPQLEPASALRHHVRYRIRPDQA